MGITRIGGPGGVDPTPGPGPKKKIDAPPAGASFADVLQLTARTQMELQLQAATPTATVDSLLAWYNNPANLVLAMSIIAAMEAGRREAIRAEMQRRDQEANMTALLAEFNKNVV